MKRRYGSGSVFRRSDGKWVGQWEMPSENGRRRRGSRVRESEAAAWRAIREAQGSNSPSRRSTGSVGAFLDRWLADVVAKTRRERTFVGYRAIVATVLPDLRDRDLRDPHLPHLLQSYLNSLDRHPRTVHHYAACLRTAFGYAVRKGLMTRNPAADLDLPAIPRTERIPLTPAQLRQLLDYTKGDGDDANERHSDKRLGRGRDGGRNQVAGRLDHDGDSSTPVEGRPGLGLRSEPEGSGVLLVSRPAGDPLHALWVTAAWTGMRQGELLGLRWEDVDLERGSLVVRRSLSRLPGKRGTRYVLTEPKTDRSRRTVPLLPEVVTVLRAVRKAQLDRPGKLDQGLVFCTPAGSPLDGSTVTRAFGRAVAAAGLPKVRMHDLRHAFASYLIQSGVDLATVADLMGHSTIVTTVQSYTHLSEGHKVDAIARLAKLA